MKILALLAATLLASCSSSTYQKVPFPRQDVVVSSPSVARIYVARQSLLGSLRDLRVSDGSTEIGTISQGEYLCWERQPGRGLIVLVYEGPKVDGGDIEGLLPIECEPGQAYYYLIEIERSYKKPYGTLLDEKAGRALIAEREPAPVD